MRGLVLLSEQKSAGGRSATIFPPSTRTTRHDAGDVEVAGDDLEAAPSI
ncbi:hypothetical protein [Saccharopolyspora hattusasensis]